MENNIIFERIIEDINYSNNGTTKRKVKTLFNQLGYKSTRSEKAINILKEGFEKYNIKSSEEIFNGISERIYINFQLKSNKTISEIQKTENPKINKKIVIPDDFFINLFEFENTSEYERFQSCLDSELPVAIFLLPLENDFYSSIVERILSFEILRKRQQKGFGSVIGKYNQANFETNNIPNEINLGWNAYDIHTFTQDTLKSAILGESIKEIIETDNFEKKFNDLALFANKYYSNDPFYLLFNYPSLIEIQQKLKENNLWSIVNKVSQKLPYTFVLKAKFKNDVELNDDIETKRKIINHFKILFETPFYDYTTTDDLIDIYTEIQKTQILGENQLFNKIDKNIFQKVHFGYESKEHIFLKYFAINTVSKSPYNCDLKNIECEVLVTNKDEELNEDFSSKPDVSFLYSNNTIVVEAETIRGKDYLKMTNELLSKGNGWKKLKNLSELWLLVPGFEVSRNYYQLIKSIEIVEFELSQLFNKKIEVKVFTPDIINQEIVECDFSEVYQLNFEISQSKSNKSIEQKKSFKIGFEDVKGLFEEKQTLNKLKLLQEQNDNIGIGGILFYGLPGCGKTHLAKSFANEMGWNFYNFSHADLTSMWLGESQQKIQAIFNQAKSKSPSIIFIDELDSIAFSRDNKDGIHSDQKSTINQLLIEINNIEKENVLVIGATNYLKNLDRAFLRTGRFDYKIPIFPPNKAERKEMLNYYLEKLNSELENKNKTILELSDENLNYLSEITSKFSSSDIEAIFNKPRIERLLEEEFDSFERLKNEVEELISSNQISLSLEQVELFVEECETNRIKSKKLDELKNEWNINKNKMGFN